MLKKIEKVIKPLSNGKVTIPAEIRKKLGINKETYLRFVLEGNSFRGIPVKAKEAVKGKVKAKPTVKEKLEAVEDIARLRIKTQSWERIKAIVAETHLISS